MLSLNRCRLYLSVVKAESHEPDQAGGAKRDIIIMVLLDSNALKQFRASSGWKAGVHGWPERPDGRRLAGRFKDQ